MKKLKSMLSVAMLLMCIVCFAQLTPEQKKQQEKAERMRDSIMNLPMFKKAMEDAKAAESMIPKSVMEKSKKEDERRKLEKARKNQQINKNTRHLDGRLIASSNEKKFDNWPHGSAEIYLFARSYDGKETYEHKVGAFNENGEFDIINNMPEVPTKVEATKFFNCKAGDLKTQASNDNALMKEAYLHVKKDNKRIGSLSIATSKQVSMQNSPAYFNRGESGYFASFFFVTEPVTISGKCVYKRKVTDGSELVEEIEVTDNYNINLQKGWNLVKEEVLTSKTVGRLPFYTTKKIAVLENNDPRARWVFSN